jgi:1,4-dihydroxy-2-naphthoyl-CoA synthase
MYYAISVYPARAVGEKRARETVVLLPAIRGSARSGVGLVNRVPPKENLMEESRNLLPLPLAVSPTALKFPKHAFNAYSAQIFGQVKMAADGLGEIIEAEQGFGEQARSLHYR